MAISIFGTIFTDINWKDMRKLDILRVIRDFQKDREGMGSESTGIWRKADEFRYVVIVCPNADKMPNNRY